MRILTEAFCDAKEVNLIGLLMILAMLLTLIRIIQRQTQIEDWRDTRKVILQVL